MNIFSFFRCLLGIAAFTFLVSCSGSWSQDDENFVQTYTEVLIAREQYPNDTAQANRSVRAIIQQHGFSESAFRQRFNDLTSKPDKLRQMLDTARNRARRIGEVEAEKERKAAEKSRQDSIAKASAQAPAKEIR
jgi:hypothetical protein